MKCINKSNPPKSYSIWLEKQETLGVNYNFGSLQNPEKGDLHKALVEEQGALCAYTMKRISLSSSHLEHIFPQHLCARGQDLDYMNLLACFPRESQCGFGARKKDDWWENAGVDFVSPLNDSCELKFCYGIGGEIYPTNAASTAAKKTIEVLKLDDESLVNDRKNAIAEFLFGIDLENPDTLSLEDAERAINYIYKPNAQGILREFCIAIHDALYEYIEIVHKSSKEKT
jgi:uncharacterized protein (TIGR02646 family)